MVTTDAGTFNSTDRGGTWQRDPSFDAIGAIAHIAIAGKRILAVTDRGVFLKNGSLWMGPSLAGGLVNVIAGGDSRAYIAVGAIAGSDITAGIYFSDDGLQWRLLTDAPADITALATDGVFLYAGTDGSSVFMTPLSLRRRAVF